MFPALRFLTFLQLHYHNKKKKRCELQKFVAFTFQPTASIYRELSMLPRSSWGTNRSYEKCKKIEGRRLPCFQIYRMKLHLDEGSQDQFPRWGPVQLSQFPWVGCTPGFSQHHGRGWEKPHSQTLQPPSESTTPEESCFQAPSTQNNLTDPEACLSQSWFVTFLVPIFFTPLPFYLS